MQQRLQGGDECHEQRAAFPMAEVPGSLRQTRRQCQFAPCGAEGIDGSVRAGRAEFDHGQRIAELLSPVFKLRDDVGM